MLLGQTHKTCGWVFEVYYTILKCDRAEENRPFPAKVEIQVNITSEYLYLC